MATADGNIRNGPAFESQMARNRPFAPGLTHKHATRTRSDGSGTFWLRSSQQGLILTTSQVTFQAAEALSEAAEPTPTPTTITPWMALLSVRVSIMGFYMARRANTPTSFGRIRQTSASIMRHPSVHQKRCSRMWKLLRMPREAV
eukprot:8805216-Pyramimonas_sp.AAC.1